MSAFPGWVDRLTLFAESILRLHGPVRRRRALSLCFPDRRCFRSSISARLWGVLSAEVLRSLVRCPFSWLMFYLEIAAIAGRLRRRRRISCAARSDAALADAAVRGRRDALRPTARPPRRGELSRKRNAAAGESTLMRYRKYRTAF